MNKWGVQKFFKAMQMVPSIHAALQVTSAFLGTFRKKYDPAKRSPKMSQKQQKMLVIIHAFGLSWAWAPNATGSLLGTWEVHGKESCGLERICGCLYVHCEIILGFTRNEQMGCSEAFQGNANGAKHPRNVTSHVSFPRNVSGKNMTRPGEFQKYRKNSQNWRL